MEYLKSLDIEPVSNSSLPELRSSRQPSRIVPLAAPARPTNPGILLPAPLPGPDTRDTRHLHEKVPSHVLGLLLNRVGVFLNWEIEALIIPFEYSYGVLDSRQQI